MHMYCIHLHRTLAIKTCPSKFTAASRGFSATARLSCIGLHQRPFKCWLYTKYADFHGRDAKLDWME